MLRLFLCALFLVAVAAGLSTDCPANDLLLRSTVLTSRVQPIALSAPIVQPVAVAPGVARRFARSSARVDLAAAAATSAALQRQQIENLQSAQALTALAASNRAALSVQFLAANQADLQTLQLLRSAQAHNSLARVQTVSIPIVSHVATSRSLLLSGGCR